MLTTLAISDVKNYIMNHLAYAKVTLNGEERRINFSKKELLPDGRIALYIPITTESRTITKITKVDLYNTSDKVWASKKENLQISEIKEGLLYRAIFDIEEKEVS